MANAVTTIARLTAGTIEDGQLDKAEDLDKLEGAQEAAEELREAIDEKEEELRETEMNLAEIEENMKSFWGKMGAAFGNDQGLADETEELGKIAADLEKFGNELVLAEEQKADFQDDVIDANESMQAGTEFLDEVQQSFIEMSSNSVDPEA